MHRRTHRLGLTRLEVAVLFVVLIIIFAFGLVMVHNRLDDPKHDRSKTPRKFS